MNIHALRLFYYVAETGSVTKAAARLRISQPAVTSQIKRLEKDLGLPLCSPSGRGISLTPFGTELAKQAGNLFTYEERIEEFVEDYRQGRKGSCALPPPIFRRERLVSLCTTYSLKPPRVTLQFSGLGEVIRSVMAGYGANFISSLAVRDYLEWKQLCRVQVEGIQLSNHIAVCTRKNETLSAGLQRFIDICRQ